MNTTLKNLELVKKASTKLSQLTSDDINQVLLSLADELMNAKSEILVENKRDLDRMSPKDPKFDRLKLTDERLDQMAAELRRVSELPSPLNLLKEERILPSGLQLKKVSVPIGVIGVIYEARPNVTLDVFSLCFKSGNACVLKGGKEAEFSNKILVQLIQLVLKQYKLDENMVYLTRPEREVVSEILKADGWIDVIIPRGSRGLIDFVREHSKIPVIETGAGIVHTYFDKSGDLKKGKNIVLNAKTRRVSVCNALDTLIIHESRLPELSELVLPLLHHKVHLYADKLAYDLLVHHYDEDYLSVASVDDFGKEFLDYKLSIKMVSGVDEAIAYIEKYSSRHSECIIAEDQLVIDQFFSQVDAAVVYANASTAFTDGAQFGMGAEIGISTQKLHARGPMALNELTSYKWLAVGSGHIRV